MYIDNMEIWFGIANGQILSNFDGYLLENAHVFVNDNLGVNIKGF